MARKVAVMIAVLAVMSTAMSAALAHKKIDRKRLDWENADVEYHRDLFKKAEEDGDYIIIIREGMEVSSREANKAFDLICDMQLAFEDVLREIEGNRKFHKNKGMDEVFSSIQRLSELTDSVYDLVLSAGVYNAAAKEYFLDITDLE